MFILCLKRERIPQRNVELAADVAVSLKQALRAACEIIWRATELYHGHIRQKQVEDKERLNYANICTVIFFFKKLENLQFGQTQGLGGECKVRACTCQ